MLKFKADTYNIYLDLFTYKHIMILYEAKTDCMKMCSVVTSLNTFLYI